MISASGDNILKLWDMATGTCFGGPRVEKSEIEREAVQTYTGHRNWIRSIVLTEDDRRMISAGDDKTLKLWDVATGACLGGSETPPI